MLTAKIEEVLTFWNFGKKRDIVLFQSKFSIEIYSLVKLHE